MYNSYNPDDYSVQKRGPGGTRINIGTLNMEPYMTSEDYERLAIEILFMVMVFYYILAFVFDIVINFYRGELRYGSDMGYVCACFKFEFACMCFQP